VIITAIGISNRGYNSD